jgi:Ca2+-transporting ATPase
MEEIDEIIMKRKPKPANEGIFANGFGGRILIQGVMFGALTLCGYYIGSAFGGNGALSGQTMAFIILALTQVIHSFNMRSERSLFKTNPFSNKKLNFAAVIGFALMIFVVFIPGVNTAFGLIYLPWHFYPIALAIASIPVPILEIVKLIDGIKAKKSV